MNSAGGPFVPHNQTRPFVRLWTQEAINMSDWDNPSQPLSPVADDDTFEVRQDLVTDITYEDNEVGNFDPLVNNQNERFLFDDEDDEYGNNDDGNYDDEEDDFEDAGFMYTPSVQTFYADEEYEIDPDDLDVISKVLEPIEICDHAFVLRNYCTNQQAREEYLKYKAEMEEEANLNPPEVPEPVEWVADDLYGSVVGRRGPVGPNPLEVDPSLAERDREPIVLTPEEEYYYGPIEPRTPPPEPKPAPPNLDLPPGSPPGSNGRAALHVHSSMAEMSLNDAPQTRNQEGIPDVGHEGPARPGEGVPEDPALLYFYDEDFLLIPGDVIILSRPRWKTRKEGDERPPELLKFVAIYEDVNYFLHKGLFRANFLDGYPLEEGDLVVRFGNFNWSWNWNRHPTINFYMYWPGLIPPVSSGKKQLHPWYWIDHGLLQYGGPDARTLPISEPVVDPHMPIGMRVPDFTLRNGDVLLHHIVEPTKIPPFDHSLECHVWNPILASIELEKLIIPEDRVLRHGMDFQFMGMMDSIVITVTTMHVELYFYDDENCWRFLGRWTSVFKDHLRREPKIRSLSSLPLAGDVVFDRNRSGRMTRAWDPDMRIGGLVSFHEWEFWKDYGRENRPFVWYKDVGKYGMGNVTMVIRYGSFEDDSNEWTWHDGSHVELYLLNTRGSAWRKAAVDVWPTELRRPRPNYSWQPYNPNDIQEVSPDFEPIFGDIIIRLTESSNKAKIQDPVYVGKSHNPHFDLKVRMALWSPALTCASGDFLIRAGYEKNHINPAWTNATVEAYFVEKVDGNDIQWNFKGRDMFIFGTNYLRGGLKNVESSGVGDYKVKDIQTINDSDTRPQFGRFR